MVVVVGELEVEMGGDLSEVGGIVEVKAKVVDKVEVEEAGMVVVEEAADMEAYHGHIVAEGGSGGREARTGPEERDAAARQGDNDANEQTGTTGTT
jgi:hypothetical protein